MERLAVPRASSVSPMEVFAAVHTPVGTLQPYGGVLQPWGSLHPSGALSTRLLFTLRGGPFQLGCVSPFEAGAGARLSFLSLPHALACSVV